MKNIKNIGLLIIGVGCLAGMVLIGADVPSEKKAGGLKECIEKYYDSISGFGIASDEEREIVDKGGFPTYGEITFESIDSLLHSFEITQKDVFVDLGCGVGKAVVYAFLNTPVKKAIGVELSKTRCENAQSVAEKIKKTHAIKRGRDLKFCHQSMLDADLSDATIIYTCSTCFSDKLMSDLTQKLSRCKQGLKVFTLKRLPDSPDFKYVKAFHLPMTWTSGTDVHFYVLDKENGAKARKTRQPR